jgi:hypothetical protein
MGTLELEESKKKRHVNMNVFVLRIIFCLSAGSRDGRIGIYQCLPPNFQPSIL